MANGPNTKTSMKEYFSETSEVRTELRKYIDKNIFSGLKTFFNIATLNKIIMHKDTLFVNKLIWRWKQSLVIIMEKLLS